MSGRRAACVYAGFRSLTSSQDLTRVRLGRPPAPRREEAQGGGEGGEARRKRKPSEKVRSGVNLEFWDSDSDWGNEGDWEPAPGAGADSDLEDADFTGFGKSGRGSKAPRRHRAMADLVGGGQRHPAWQPDGDRRCSNCGTARTSQWRKERCNACGLYIAKYFLERPPQFWGKSPLEQAAQQAQQEGQQQQGQRQQQQGHQSGASEYDSSDCDVTGEGGDYPQGDDDDGDFLSPTDSQAAAAGALSALAGAAAGALDALAGGQEPAAPAGAPPPPWAAGPAWAPAPGALDTGSLPGLQGWLPGSSVSKVADSLVLRSWPWLRFRSAD